MQRVKFSIRNQNLKTKKPDPIKYLKYEPDLNLKINYVIFIFINVWRITIIIIIIIIITIICLTDARQLKVFIFELQIENFNERGFNYVCLTGGQGSLWHVNY